MTGTAPTPAEIGRGYLEALADQDLDRALGFWADEFVDDLVGVAVLSVPMGASVLSNVFPELQPNTQALELGRLVLTDTPANAESWFLRRVFESASAEGIRGVVSFSDPMPRTRTVVDENGRERVDEYKAGHIGICYQATNALALGRSTRRTLTYLPRHGLVLSDRTLQKIRAQESGGDGEPQKWLPLFLRSPVSSGRGIEPEKWLPLFLIPL